MHARTRTHTSKAVTQLLPTSEPAPGYLAPLRCLSLVQQILGLVIRRRAVQVSQIEIAEPKVPQWPHSDKWDKDSWTFASPVYTRYPLMFTHTCMHTHTHKKQSKVKAKSLATVRWWGTCALSRHCESRWQIHRASTHRWGCAMLHSDGMGTWSPTYTSPIRKTWTAVGHLFPQLLPGTYWFYSWQLGRVEQCE